MKKEQKDASVQATGYRMPEELNRILEDARIKDISREAQSRYANIMYDTAFKLIFGTRANRKLLIELLECLIPEKKISDVTFHDKEIPGYFIGDKKTVFDLFCTSTEGDTFVVEMQLVEQNYFTDRMLFYSTYPIREQIVSPLEEERIRKRKAKVHQRDTYRLDPVYMVGILDFRLPHEQKDCLREGLVSTYSIRSDHGEGGEQMTDALHFVFLELDRLTIDKDHPEQCRSLLEKIAFAFRHISFLNERPVEFGEEFFRHLFHAAELANMTSIQRRHYDRDMQALLDYRAQMKCATEKGLKQGIEEGLKQGIEKGLKQGIEKGHKQGLKEGRAKGRAEGREEGRAEGRAEQNQDNAREMMRLGISEEIICQVTKLSPEELRNLSQPQKE